MEIENQKKIEEIQTEWKHVSDFYGGTVKVRKQDIQMLLWQTK